MKGRYIQYGHISAESLQQNNDELSLGCCFLPPESRQVLQGTGILRDWPDARGFWTNAERTLICKINEVDHITFTYAEVGEGELRKITAVIITASNTAARNEQRSLNQSGNSGRSNKAGYTAQDAPSMRTFHLRK